MAYLSVIFLLLSIICLKNNKAGVFALTDMHIKVPAAVKRGSSVTMACDYDLEEAALYSIKWYRDNIEFYRYIPKESPPSQVYPLPHLNVDVSKSNWKEVTLNNVERETSGEFICEVSADAPLFHTDIRSADLLVVDIPDPDDGPVLKTEAQKVAKGEQIRANCTAPLSYPGMNITWFINDEEIPNNGDIYIHTVTTRYENRPGLEGIQSVITIQATSNRFKGSKMKLRCLATLFTLYAVPKEVEIQEESPQLALIMVPINHSSGEESVSTSIHIDQTFMLSIFLVTFISRL